MTVYLHLHTCNVGTSLQRISPRCQVPVKAVRGVRGADTRQMIMSDTAMLQMYMLEVVLSSGRLVDIIIIIINLDISSEELLPGHGEEDQHVADDAGRDDETVDHQEGQLYHVNIRR